MSASAPTSTSSTTASAVCFHIALNVADLPRSCEFFAQFLGRPPAARHDDYAKFELDEPPLVLSLEPHRASGTGTLSHLGFRLPDSAALVEMQRRLEAIGIATRRENGVACCHSLQTKFWVSDPDGNLWEIYTLDADLDGADLDGVDNAEAGDAPPARVESRGTASAPPPAVAIWAHRLDEPAPSSIPALAASVDQVHLQGSFNADWTDTQPAALLAEAARILKSGGELLVHALVADSPLAGPAPKLAGPARLVEFVPTLADVLRRLSLAGFLSLEVKSLAAEPTFLAGDVALREVRLRAVKRGDDDGDCTFAVLYRGPFKHVVDDTGQLFRRGEFTCVTEATWQRISQSLAHEQFVLATDAAACAPQ